MSTPPDAPAFQRRLGTFVPLAPAHSGWDPTLVNGSAAAGLLALLLARDPRERFPGARALARALTPLVIDRVAAERRLASALHVGVGTQEGKVTLHEFVAA